MVTLRASQRAYSWQMIFFLSFALGSNEVLDYLCAFMWGGNQNICDTASYLM